MTVQSYTIDYYSPQGEGLTGIYTVSVDGVVLGSFPSEEAAKNFIRESAVADLQSSETLEQYSKRRDKLIQDRLAKERSGA
jgi:hypothetical protein